MMNRALGRFDIAFLARGLGSRRKLIGDRIIISSSNEETFKIGLSNENIFSIEGKNESQFIYENSNEKIFDIESENE